MPAYSFEALDAHGQTRKGVIDADTQKVARTMLRAQALVPLNVVPVNELASRSASQVGNSALGRLFAKKVFRSTGLAVWTRQLAGLVGAGLPIERALTALLEEAEEEQQRNLMADLRYEVNAGSPFAKALAKHPTTFSDIYVSVVSAGEQSGNLGPVLEQLATALEEGHALRSKLMSAMLYPAIVTLIAIAIVFFLMTYVVPQIANVFEGTKQTLPLLTRAMLATSHLLRNFGWTMLLAIAVGVVFIQQTLKAEPVRLAFDAALLKAPLIGKLLRGYNASRFASTLAMLALAGVPILKALQSAAETLGNRAMRADALDALILVREGAPLASAMSQKKRFPGIVSMFARLGEQTGQLPVMLQRAADQLSAEVQRRSMNMATLLEPLLIVAMGGMVMLIVLAVLLPIIQLNQWVR